MNKLVLLVTVFALSLNFQMSAQVESTVKSSKSNSSEKAKLTGGDMNANKMKGYPPHGYPCLGCAPCVPATNPVSYCDNTAAKLSPHPEALALGFVFTGGKMIPLATILARPDVVKKMGELGSAGGNAKQQKVKCNCGTDVYGKDDAACGRICEFLASLK